MLGLVQLLYGPNAFNGVIYMESKDPFMFPGTQYQIKIGERALVENGFRFAKSYKDKEGNDRFGFKINLQHFKANDWEADNNNATDDSDGQTNNLGGWDAVNIYGDERGFENTNFGIYPG